MSFKRLKQFARTRERDRIGMPVRNFLYIVDNELVMFPTREIKTKQANKQTNKQTNKQANKQTNKPTNKQTDEKAPYS